MNVQTKRRGRPTLSHDNHTVYAFLKHYDLLSNLTEDYPQMESILFGASWLQEKSQASTRPLSRKQIFQVLRHCQVITTKGIQGALKDDLSPSQVHRYFMASRVASNALKDLLERSPEIMEGSSSLKTSREALDAPYLDELEALL